MIALLLLRRIPGIAWVITGSVIAIAAGLWFIYASGRQAGEVRVHRKALADSIEKAALVQKLAVDQTDRTRKRASEVKQLTDSGRAIRNRLRESVASYMEALPDPVVRLIEADDAQIHRDSLAIAAYVAVDTTWARERALSQDLDSLRINQVAVGVTPPTSRHKMAFVAGVVVTIGAAFLIHAAVR